MALTITYVPGYVWTLGELVTEDKLNLAANPTINLAGSINSTSIADGSVSTAKVQDGFLSADATGRAKMADLYLIASKLGPDVAGDGLQGGNGSPIAFYPDGITLTTVGGKAVVKSTGAGVLGSTRGLLVFNNAGTPNTKIDLSASEAILKSAANLPFLALALSTTIDATVNGANGLDTGAMALSTWYYVWGIAKADGTKAGLLSVATTIGALTLPSGYIYAALLGAARSDATTHFTTFYQQDQDVYLNQTNVFTAKTAAVDDTYEAYSAGAGGANVSLLTLVPPIARKLRGTIGNSSSTANQSMAIAGDANGLGAQINVAAALGSSNALDGFSAANGFEVPMKTAQTIYWKSTGPTARNRMSISGYKL